ncbi:hypothetical protein CAUPRSCDRAFT_12100 [Caulochytrium protostelioides]|nr:hypothetical protein CAUPRSCDRAFT_12100 [Caulochytrium protostelioides]
MADLNRAIHYARHTREPAADPHPPASGAAAPADAAMADSGDRLALLGQIYTQRAVLHKQNGAEGAADLDFAQGARFGNAVAKRAVKENPYGKLCNATMAHAMARLYQPQANEAGPQPAAGPPR